MYSFTIDSKLSHLIDDLCIYYGMNRVHNMFKSLLLDFNDNIKLKDKAKFSNLSYKYEEIVGINLKNNFILELRNTRSLLRLNIVDSNNPLQVLFYSDLTVNAFKYLDLKLIFEYFDKNIEFYNSKK